MKIICIGRNYRNHAEEMDSDVPDEPMFFMKPETALVESGNAVPYPSFTADLQYELELVLQFSERARDVPQEKAMELVDHIGLGIDFTARDIQRELKSRRHPWERSKAFDGAAYIGDRFVSSDLLDDTDSLEFTLSKNGSVVQEADTDQMIFSPAELIANVSRVTTLKPGDVMFTGTPEGVGAVDVGDRFLGHLNGVELLSCRIAD